MKNFGNCIDCHQYSTLDLDSRCPICEIREKEILQTAQLLLKANPKLDRDELAEKLQIEISRVEAWIRSGKIRCNSLNSHCPKCRSTMKSFSCDVCKYNTADELKNDIEPTEKKPAPKMHSQRANRFNRTRKRSAGHRD